jgi:hypothetical protein
MGIGGAECLFFTPAVDDRPAAPTAQLAAIRRENSALVPVAARKIVHVNAQRSWEGLH